MGRRSHTRALSLWMNGVRVGTWLMAPHSPDTLQYAPNWVQSREGRPLSMSLPFTPGNTPHRGERVRHYFDNLLPDSPDIRARLARRYQATSTDAFDVLAQAGQDCVGALQILPDDASPAVASLQARPLSNSEVAAVLRHATAATAPGFMEDDDFRISIAGAQEKTALLRLDGQWCMPQGATPTTHILKLPLGLVGGMGLDLRESVENEWLCAQILAAYGLPVARCEPVQFEDIKALAVERFDRMWWAAPDGQQHLIRLPQEDLCQATATAPDLKYEAQGGPGIDRIMSVLAGSMTPEQDKRTFFTAQVLFWILCAPDGHAKNFSLFIRPGGRYQLTPLYDVISAYPILGNGPNQISPFKVKLAMAVRGKNAHWKMHDIQRRHWVAMGKRHGVVTVDGKPAQALLDELVGRTPEVISQIRRRLPEGFPQQMADSILQGLARASERLRA
ncbi:type II toxin-antitoxin system HipA family toxin [Aquabacterium sp.]|uniref:type II toxin-antitoxin system HipA family toxin n=1 Tax=Aquabacterium sp. TaxID=1872578 RepID=UPI00403789BA